MLNAPTLAAGLAVSLLIVISMYFTYAAVRRGGCGGCSGCPDAGRNRTCGKCPKKDR